MIKLLYVVKYNNINANYDYSTSPNAVNIQIDQNSVKNQFAVKKLS